MAEAHADKQGIQGRKKDKQTNVVNVTCVELSKQGAVLQQPCSQQVRPAAEHQQRKMQTLLRSGAARVAVVVAAIIHRAEHQTLESATPQRP